MYKTRSMKFYLLILISLLFMRCGIGDRSKEKEFYYFDLTQIKAKDTIRVVTDYNSINYFIYKGMEIGYQYDLLQEISKSLGVTLVLTASNDINENYKLLLDGKVDLIATNLPELTPIANGLSFTEPHCFSRQVLVQRKGRTIEYLDTLSKRTNRVIRDLVQLGGRTIYVEDGSAYNAQLLKLKEEISDSIKIIQDPDYTAEQLIGLVASGEIDYTVCDENIAVVNSFYYSNLDLKTPISQKQKISWVCRSNSKELIGYINQWLLQFRNTFSYASIYQKYFVNKRTPHIVDTKPQLIRNGKLSVFDDLIKSESKNIRWDWRLLASVIYQESRFDPEARSWAGAAGLMQLMPETANDFGVTSITSPRDNIKGGVRYLQWLQTRINPKISNEQDRIKFTLASYNVGLGHVFDAMKLAEKYGKNPKVWTDNVDYYILNKSLPEFYTDTIVKHGYCRGEETFKYVEEVLARYDNIKRVIK